MSEKIREELRKIIKIHGEEICNDSKKCKAFLADLCSNQKREINILLSAVQERIPYELTRNTSVSFELLRPRLVKTLEESTGLSEENSAWAIDTWAFALGFATFSQTVADNKEKPAIPAECKTSNYKIETESDQTKFNSQNDAEVFTKQGNSHYDQKQFNEALQCFENALKIDSNCHSAWNGKGLSLHGLNRYSEAIDCFDKAIELDQNSASFWCNKANSFFWQNQLQKARQCYEQALRLEPDNPYISKP